MIKTAEYFNARDRRTQAIHPPGMISTDDYLPYIGEYVPIITKLGSVMRGSLQIGQGTAEPENEIYWICTPLSYRAEERRLDLIDVLFWIG